MKREQKFLFRVIVFLMIAVVLFDHSSLYVFANDLNANEQRVVDEISGVFEVGGKTYKLESNLITEVKSYLSSHGVDLTDEQSRNLIQYFYDNIHTAILENYLILVESTEASLEEANQSGETPLENTDQTGEALGDSANQTGEAQGKETDPEEEGNPDKKINSGEDVAYHEGSNTNDTNINGEDTNQDVEPPDAYIEDNLIDEIKNQIDHIGNDNFIDGTEHNPDSTQDIEMGEATDNAKDQKASENSVSNADTRSNTAYKIIFGGIVLLFFGITWIVLYRRHLSARNMGKNHFNQNQMNQDQEIQGHYIDIHAHILPGVDDGASNMEETVKMLKLAWEQGIHTIIATPHYYVGRKTTPERLAEIKDEVQKEAKKIDKDFRILLGNEIFYEEGCLESLKQNKVCTMAGSRYVLVEFSPDESFQQIYDGMRDFIMEGYSPIIAHVERYRCLLNKKERIRSLIQLGCYIQVNANSIQRRFLFSGATYIKGLIAENLVHFIATDCHNVGVRSPNMEDGIRALKKVVGEAVIIRLTITNPSKIIEKKFI